MSSDIENELSIDNEKDLDDVFYKDMSKFQNAVMLLKNANAANDKITVQAALVYVRVHAMRLSGFFEDVKDDSDNLLQISN